ncbi:hypothetical protein DAETH_05290 [Deinococcus aetherius]|uniref:Uncharacterized protein n=1 Tax=Deinococcus aetherius TaxID=200252 RepID=A0ABM8A9X3_9DEIO|nr:hypothetical protein [Deinococcus aetherius]BDP40560.1 hypothetical protein DAETH_05290 [Deinococcus aetherius]
MKHLLFPTVAQADAFVQELQSRGVIQPEMGQTSLNRSGGMSGGMSSTGGMSATETTTTTVSDGSAPPYVEGGVAEEAGDGAIKGTGVGAAVGTIAGAVATAATGGLAAVPVILGMAALGSGVGAGVGAVGGAAGSDDAMDTTRGGYQSSYDISGEQHDRLSSGMSSGGRAIAVDDSVPADIVSEVAARHGGQFV